MNTQTNPAFDKKAIACNYLECTSSVSKGALAYVVATSGAAERINILVRSKGGRWIKKWESFKRLGNFRGKTIPPSHPRFSDQRIRDYSSYPEEVNNDLEWFEQIKSQ